MVKHIGKQQLETKDRDSLTTVSFSKYWKRDYCTIFLPV